MFEILAKKGGHQVYSWAGSVRSNHTCSESIAHTILLQGIKIVSEYTVLTIVSVTRVEETSANVRAKGIRASLALPIRFGLKMYLQVKAGCSQSQSEITICSRDPMEVDRGVT